MAEREAGRAAAAEIRRSVADVGRTGAPFDGGERGLGVAVRRRVARASRLRLVPECHRQRHPGDPAWRPGAGRKPITAHDPELLAAVDRLIEPDTLGDPESPLRWVCKSTRVLAAELANEDHPISHVKL